MLLCSVPTAVTSDLPSGATAMPSSWLVPDVICCGTPSGNFSRQRWKPLPASAEKYIHLPSGDHAALVHLDGAGPTTRPCEPPLKGVRRQGSQPRLSISTTSTHLRSGER